MPSYTHVLITGGAGFIGSHLARRLIAEGRTVTVVDNLSNGFRENVPAQATFIHGDISDPAVCQILADIPFDAVAHLAAQSSGALSFEHPEQDMASHVPGTFNMLRLCLAKGVQRFLYTSSSTTYGDAEYLPVNEIHPQRPKMYYSAGKAAAESYIAFARSQAMDTTIFRLPNVYGPGQNLENKNQGMISIYLSYLLEGQPILVKGSTERFRDFVYIDDVIQGFMLALENTASFGQTYNLGSGIRSTVGDVLTALLAACDAPDYPVIVEGSTPGDQTGMVLDISKITQELGYNPTTDLAEGIRRMVSHDKRRTLRA